MFHCYRESTITATIGSRWLQPIFQGSLDLRVTNLAFGHTLTRMLGHFDSRPKIGRVKPVVRGTLSLVLNAEKDAWLELLLIC